MYALFVSCSLNLFLLQPRFPFVLLRGKKRKDGPYFVEEVASCSDIKPFKKRDTEHIQLLICHGQRSADLSVFLYSVLDVQVSHAFFQNTSGELNIKNFQRFESKGKSQSLTLLNSSVRVMEPKGYEQLRCLILVSCKITRLTLEGLKSLELLDVRFNRLQELHPTISECKSLKTLRISHNFIRRLPREVSELRKLVVLEAASNGMRRVSSGVAHCANLRCLQLNNNDLLQIPVDIGLLLNLEELLLQNNKLAQLPLSIANIKHLKQIRFHNNPLLNIPKDFPERAAEVRDYLQALQDDPVPNNVIKLVLVGQEGVGKSTLLKAIRRATWVLPHTPNVTKTEGIEVKDIQVNDLTFRCFDCGGDVDFNETHNFFITQGALYLACFNLSEYTKATLERNSFLLGRLELWLQYIYSRVPNARVIIVGTHADHESLKRKLFEEIWEQVRTMLVNARQYHQHYFRKGERLRDCMLCQPDTKCLRKSMGDGRIGFVNLDKEDVYLDEETTFSEGQGRVVTFPHIVGYYEISSVRKMGNDSIFDIAANKSIDDLKNAMVDIGKKLTKNNPEIPRKWANVYESLQNQMQIDPVEHSVCNISEVARIAHAQGVKTETDLRNMLHFLKAQGSLLFFPRSDILKDLVVLDPEWLAKIFASVVSFRETGITDEGFIHRNDLRLAYKDVSSEMQDKIISLLHYFGVSIAIDDTDDELIPSKLPLGDQYEDNWPVSPPDGQRQVTYSVTFPGLIPPPFFSDLIVAVYRRRVIGLPSNGLPKYFSNQFVETVRLRESGCRDCCARGNQGSPLDEIDQIHMVQFELVAHKRTIAVTARGQHPCCLIKKLNHLVNRVMSKYEGLGILEMDAIVCPGCYMAKSNQPHRFSSKILLTNIASKEKILCANGHTTRNTFALLIGDIHESCMPYATVKPKAHRERMDFMGCPKLFIALPVNQDGLTFDSRSRLFASSVLIDGYAVHLVCEFPDGYHLTGFPGYRLKNPKDFMTAYGNHVVSVMRMLVNMVHSSVITGGMSSKAHSLNSVINDLVKDYKTKFGIKDSTSSMSLEELVRHVLETAARFSRKDLRSHLNVMDKPAVFGPLRRLTYKNNILWLCNEHYRQLRVLTAGLHDVEEGEGSSA